MLAFLLMVFMGGFGMTVTTHLKSGGYTTSTSESTRASQYVADHFPSANPNVVVVVSDPRGVDNPLAAQIGGRIARQVAQRSDVSAVQSHWTANRVDLATILRSNDGTSALILITTRGDDNAAAKAAASIAEEAAAAQTGEVTVRTTGLTKIADEINREVARDLVMAEVIVVPVSALVLLFVFGSVIAALLPVGIGVFSVALTLGILRVFTLFTDVSIFALNMTTALSLALGIDYSLLLVNRYREEFAGGLNFEEAMARAIQTAGRTVLFSALTVALSVAALAIVPLYFLRSFAYTAIAVVIAAAAAGLLVVPALIVLLGNKLEAFSIRYFARRLGFDTDPNADPARSVWYRWTRFVMQHAALVAVAVVSALLFLGHPFVDLRLGSPDEHVLPLGAPSRQAAEIVKRDFPLPLGNASYAVLPNYSGDATALEHYSSTLSSVTDVQAVLSGGGVYIKGQRFGAGSPSLTDPEGSVVIIASAVDPYSVNGTALLSNLKRVPSPSKVLFGGPIAQNTETIDVVATCLPYVIGIVIVVSLLLLLLFTGSLLLPFKALIVNGLSLTATFGSMVWIFQEGHLSKVLGITPTGTVAGAIPILMFCLAFGMSMDYEVFLLSRIREEWLVSDQTPAANAHAVATGVALTGRIFTAAALLMAIVFASLATSGVSFMKMFGIGLALAVIMDATVVRACLVPAVMQLTRRFNWWLPSSLRAIHARFGLEE